MKTILVHRSLRPDARLATRVREKLNKLASLARIEVAEVTFEHSAASSPPFVVRIHPAVPGPDLHLEEKEHTLQAAVHKAFGRLARLVRKRKEFLKTKRKAEVDVPRSRSKSPQSFVFQGTCSPQTRMRCWPECLAQPSWRVSWRRTPRSSRSPCSACGGCTNQPPGSRPSRASRSRKSFPHSATCCCGARAACSFTAICPRWRETPENRHSEKHRRLLVLTVNGIAFGMKSTG